MTTAVDRAKLSGGGEFAFILLEDFAEDGSLKAGRKIREKLPDGVKKFLDAMLDATPTAAQDLLLRMLRSGAASLIDVPKFAKLSERNRRVVEALLDDAVRHLVKGMTERGMEVPPEAKEKVEHGSGRAQTAPSGIVVMKEMAADGTFTGAIAVHHSRCPEVLLAEPLKKKERFKGKNGQEHEKVVENRRQMEAITGAEYRIFKKSNGFSECAKCKLLVRKELLNQP